MPGRTISNRFGSGDFNISANLSEDSIYRCSPQYQQHELFEIVLTVYDLCMPYSSAGQALSVHRFLFRCGLAIGNVFAWILVFDYLLYFTRGSVPDAFVLALFYYAIAQLVIFLTVPLAAQYLRSGARRALGISTLVMALAFAWLSASFAGFLGHSLTGIAWGSLLFVLFSGLYRSLYFVPYRVSAGVLSGWKPYMHILFELYLTIMPIVGGLLISSFVAGPSIMLASVAFLMLLSLIPLLHVPETYESFDWSYGQTLKRFLDARNHSLVMASIFDGMQGAALLFIWPLAAFAIVGWSYMLLGVVLSISLMLAFFIKSFIRAMRVTHIHRSPSILTAVSVGSWLLRLFTFTPGGIVLADTLYHAGTPKKIFGLDPAILEQTADDAHYIDEYTALKEMGLAIGKITVCLAAGILAFYVSALIALASVLVAASIASLISIFFVRMREPVLQQ